MATFKYQSKAITEINPDASWRSGGTVETIEWLNNTAPISVADINTKADELEQADADAKAQKEANIASTKAKLEALGLTTDEVKDTFGL